MKHIVILFFLCTTNIIFAQSEFGINSGMNNSNFYNFFLDDSYETNHTAYNNISFSMHYKEQINESEFYGFEIENKGAKSNLELRYNIGHGSFYHSVLYDLNLISLYFIYGNEIITKTKFSLSFVLCPYLESILQSKAKGNGWKYGSSQLQIDTNGNYMYNSTILNWNKDEINSTDLKKNQFGIRFGLQIRIPINESFTFTCSNSYNYGLSPTLKNEIQKNVRLRNFGFVIGLAYVFDKKLLNIWHKW